MNPYYIDNQHYRVFFDQTKNLYSIIVSLSLVRPTYIDAR